MALVRCPECGKENVSDKAESCPQCGFSINKYFIELKSKQEAEEKARKREFLIQDTMNNISIPQKPKIRKIPLILLGIWFGLILILIVIAFLNQLASNFILESLVTVLVITVLSSIFIIAPYNIYVMSKDNPKFEEYEKATKDPESYKRQKAMEQLGLIENNLSSKSNIKCPVCGSNNISSVSTLDRLTSICCIGLASAKIGKTFECNDCGYKW